MAKSQENKYVLNTGKHKRRPRLLNNLIFENMTCRFEVVMTFAGQ